MQSECTHLHIAPLVVGTVVAPVVPCLVVDFNVEAVLGKAEVGMDDAFGLWKDDPLDGLEYEARLRSEWS